MIFFFISNKIIVNIYRMCNRWSNIFRRIIVISACCLLYMALWSSYLYFNAKVTDEDGDEVPFHEALGHFFSSPWWLDVKQSFVDVWQFAQEHGWMETWRQIVSLSDPSGEQNAFKVRPSAIKYNNSVSHWNMVSKLIKSIDLNQ